jgi:acetyl-CoA synthetase
MLRTVYKDPERYKTQYWSVYGPEIYYTSDGAIRWDDLGNIRLTGRVDDVMKVAGHRLSTAEVENALTQHSAVAECAVVAAPHEIKGEVPVAFVTLKEGFKPSATLENELMQQVVKVIGPTARPDKIFLTEALPKTRSGKIMRRILKSLVKNEPVGDTTTLMNPEAVEDLKQKVDHKT